MADKAISQAVAELAVSTMHLELAYGAYLPHFLYIIIIIITHQPLYPDYLPSLLSLPSVPLGCTIVQCSNTRLYNSTTNTPAPQLDHPQMALAKQHLKHCCSMFKDLIPKLSNYVYDNGQEYEMICLGGTIPMPYKGKLTFLQFTF